MFADRNLINRRNVRDDPHTAYRAGRDFMVLEVTARVIAAAFLVLGLESKQDKPKHFTIPENLASQSKFHQLQFLHKAAAKIVDEVVIDETMMNGSLEEMISIQEIEEILNQLELISRFPGCKASFKYNGKSRNSHELGHNPPVVVSEDISDATTESTNLPSKDADDMFNYNAALLSEGLFFLNFLDAVSEGDGMRIIRQ